MMTKLVSINQRKPHHYSTPALSLPPIKEKRFRIPVHEE